MNTRVFDPHCVDVAAFAKQGVGVSGAWPLARLDRLCDEAHADAKPNASAQVQWRATGEIRTRRGAEPAVWLHIESDAQLSLVCQRCLQPVDTSLQARRSFQFAADEQQAAAIDADSEDDVLAISRTLNLMELIEDELLLALPLVPRHGSCPQPLTARDEGSPLEERANPFAVLQSLKRSPASD
jgi:uncharacterized protein